MYLQFICILLLISPVTFAFVQGDCISCDAALSKLSFQLSPGAAISCRNSPLQKQNAKRYWGEQYGKNATIVVFPVTKEDVSHAVRAASFSRHGERDLAFVCGGHGQTNASSSSGFLIDLSWMNSTKILHNLLLEDVTISTAIAYQGGAIWKQVTDTTNGTGFTAVGARVGSVGVGGFSTGGGIGFLAGAYGYAIDRLRALEVVLMSGKIVLATKTNRYSDLFWAMQGGGGQFGIVTTFYQEAVPEPTSSQFGIWVVARESWERARQNTVDFFRSNNDPYSLMYYSLGYYPEDLAKAKPTTLYGPVPKHTRCQKGFNSTFSGLLDGLVLKNISTYNVPYGQATELSTLFFPYGHRRGFWGPQTSNVTMPFVVAASRQMELYINQSLSRGESPDSAVWVLQYMYLGQNGHGPTSDEATAWPHAQPAHQTLFSPSWESAENDAFVVRHNDALNQITYNHQASIKSFIADYPNYISPKADGHRVWGDNIERLIEIKAKYDPECRIHQGRVFASETCIERGWADIYPWKS
ncbi:FAD-binding domain-containing protein [Aureobasidium subglaciale]|nr:FAD-binding domain-containing protein [Aureobasidium subglaciale]